MNFAVPTPSLVERCIAGEPLAWDEFYRQTYPMVKRFLRRVGVFPGDAEDVAQEVFLQVFRYLPRFEGRAELKTWLYKLCVSQAERARRRARLRAALGRLIGRTDEPAAPGPRLLEPEAHQIVVTAIRRIKHHHAAVLVLYELEGLSGQEIADVLGCPVATVWRRLHYARKELAALLDEPAKEGAA